MGAAFSAGLYLSLCHVQAAWCVTPAQMEGSVPGVLTLTQPQAHSEPLFMVPVRMARSIPPAPPSEPL